MPEEIIIKEMPKNPYLEAFFEKRGLGVGDKWLAADYITWVDRKHEEFRRIHHLPSHIELNENERNKFVIFLKERSTTRQLNYRACK